MHVLHSGRSPEHLVFRLRQVRHAALILRRFVCGCPSVVTNLICFGGGRNVVESVERSGFEAALMLRGAEDLSTGTSSDDAWYAKNGGGC